MGLKGLESFFPSIAKGLKSGGEVGTSEAQSEGDSKVRGYLQGLKGNRSNEDYGNAIANQKQPPLTQVKDVKNPYSKEKIDSEARTKISETMYDAGNDWQDPIKNVQKRTLSNNPIPTAKDLLISQRAEHLIKSSLMPDGFEANRVLATSELGNAGEDNLTAKALRKKADEYNRAVQSFRDLKFYSGNQETDNPMADYRAKDMFYDAAMKAYAEKNSLFKKQIEKAGLPNVESSAKRGQVMQLMMNDPDFVAYVTKENPNLLPLVDKVNCSILFTLVSDSIFLVSYGTVLIEFSTVLTNV